MGIPTLPADFVARLLAINGAIQVTAIAGDQHPFDFHGKPLAVNPIIETKRSENLAR